MTFLVLISILFVVENVYFFIAKKFNIVDKPNERSLHLKITIRGGGIIFLISIILYFINSGFKFPVFIVGLSAITIISFLDDICTISNRSRIIVQIISVFVMLYITGFGSFIVMVSVSVQRLLSLTVTVYVPAIKPEKVGEA